MTSHLDSPLAGRLAPLLVTIAILAATTGAWLAMTLLRPPPPPTPAMPQVQAATLLPTPKPLHGIALIGRDGAPVTAEGLRGHWTFLAFGFTSCADVCPTTLATLAAVERKLAAAGSDPAQFLFVSVDPERDSPERVDDYAHYFNPQFLGATASHAELGALTQQLGVIYARAPEQDGAAGYLVDHSAAILLIDPEVHLAAIFGAPHDPMAMAADFAAIAARR
ncbi:MAG: SCO family protein [Chromatiaceae bacterium]|jgi:protein SCO1/2|nr:SCO family protein [Chromatiaceae bacterium]